MCPALFLVAPIYIDTSLADFGMPAGGGVGLRKRELEWYFLRKKNPGKEFFVLLLLLSLFCCLIVLKNITWTPSYAPMISNN